MSVAQMYLPPGRAGLPRRARLPISARSRQGSSSRGRRTSHRRALLFQEGGGPRAAQIIANNLAAIGIDVRVHCLPGGEMWYRILNPKDPWDLAVDGGAWGADPGAYLNALASRRAHNVSHLHDPRVDALLNAAARRSGLARAFAYARIDHMLVRDVAPWIVFANESAHDFFSARIGCQLYQPLAGIDLGALCVRTRPH